MRDIASPLDGFSSPFGPGRRTLTNLLFGQNEPGFTFEPWDITTLYQDRAGTTPVTDAGQSVGYRRDKSGRGNHEVAVSDAKRGVYGWMPKTGRRNLLTYTEQFDNAAWEKRSITISATQFTAPDGSLTADKIVETTATDSHYAASGAISVTAQPYTASCYVKAVERTWALVRFGFQNSGRFVNLLNGQVGSVYGSTPSNFVVQNAGNGWYRVSVTFTPSAGNLGFAVETSFGDGINNYTGDGTSGILIWGAQLEAGSTATAYQRVVSQYDITEAGVPTCYYVQADGVDDAYVTPTITPNTDKVQVFAGVRKLSDAAVGVVAELSASLDANNGTWNIVAPGGAGAATYYFGSKGTTAQGLQTPSSYASPIANVLTGTGDISGDRVTTRVNGVQVQQDTDDQGTGNYLAYPAYIYGRGGTSLPFNGLDFGHAVRFGPNLDAATIARVESLIARNTPEVDFLFGGVWNDGYAWNDNTNWNDGA